MVGVSGTVASKKVNKTTRLFLNYDWESYKYILIDEKGKYEGSLPGDGETYLMIEKETLPDPNAENFEILYQKEYEGGGECAFDDNLNEVPKEFLKVWNKLLSEYKSKNEKNLKPFIKKDKSNKKGK